MDLSHRAFHDTTAGKEPARSFASRTRASASTKGMPCTNDCHVLAKPGRHHRCPHKVRYKLAGERHALASSLAGTRRCWAKDVLAARHDLERRDPTRA